MESKNTACTLCDLASLALAAYEAPTPTTPSGAQQTATLSESGLQACESTTKRILSTPHNDQHLIRAAYGSRLKFLLLRGLNAEPGTDHWINWDYVYEMQDAMPKVLSVGPGVAEGSRVVVPVFMQWPHGQPPQKKSWIFEQENTWTVSDVINFDGTSLASNLNA